MAHFAEMDETNTVLRVIVVANDDTADADGTEIETIGAQFCNDLLGGTWVQTSYNNNLRVQFAGIGYTYDESLDAFIAPQPFPSWGLNSDTADWEPPSPVIPGCEWDEDTPAWVQPDSPFPSWEWVDNRWQPPVPYPIDDPGPDDPPYEWDEDTTSWVEATA